MATVAKRIDALDGLRAISVLVVIASHIGLHSSIKLDYSGPFLDHPLFRVSQWAVYCFFVISGFVITRGLIAEHERSGTISIAGFFIRRAFRILPPLALYLATLKVLAANGLIAVSNQDLALAAAFACNLHDIGIVCDNWFLGHMWSLSFEEQFYLVFPFVFAFAIKGGLAGRVCAGLGLAAVMVATKIAAGEIYFPLRGFVIIGIGVIAAFHEGTIRKVLAWLRLPNGFSAGLSWPPLVAIGQMSYGLYLWQQLACYPLPGAGYGFYALTLAACFGWCWLSFRFFERPLTRLGARLAGRRRAAMGSALKVGG